MIVKELIEKLKLMPQDQDVFYYGAGKWIILEVTNNCGEVQLQP